MKTSLGIWALGADGDPVRARRLPAGARPESTGEKVQRAVDGLERAGRRLRVPLSAASSARTTSTRCAPRSTATASTASPPACTSTRASARAGSPRSTPGSARRRAEITRAAADFAGELGAHFIIWPGIEGYNYPFQAPYPRAGAADRGHRRGRRDLRGAGRQALPRAQELRARDEDPHGQHRDGAAHHPQAARPRGSTTSRSTWTGST